MIRQIFIIFSFLVFINLFSEENSDVHGFFDLTFKNDYMTPRGLLVTDDGLTIQILGGLALDIYKNPCGNVSKISFFVGVWNDLWTEQQDKKVGSWNELDWFVGNDIYFKNHFKIRSQFIQFLSPPGNFKPENNAEFTLSYDDAHFDLPITFNPYMRLFWAISGDSTVVVGRKGNTYYLELGISPSIDVHCINLSAPTWISFGPKSFWNGGSLALKNENSHFGVLSTGLKATYFIPTKTLGKWYINGGFQYYYLINKNLLQAQLFTLGLTSVDAAKRNVWVGYGGLGFEF